MKIKFRKVKRSTEIFGVLKQFADVFPVGLERMVGNLSIFAEKLSKYAEVYFLQNEQKEILGFEAFYVNNLETKEAYLSLIAVLEKHQGNNYGKLLLDNCEKIAAKKEMRRIKLEVSIKNHRAIRFYKNNEFSFVEMDNTDRCFMLKNIDNESKKSKEFEKVEGDYTTTCVGY